MHVIIRMIDFTMKIIIITTAVIAIAMILIAIVMLIVGETIISPKFGWNVARYHSYPKCLHATGLRFSAYPNLLFQSNR